MLTNIKIAGIYKRYWLSLFYTLVILLITSCAGKIPAGSNIENPSCYDVRCYIEIVVNFDYTFSDVRTRYFVPKCYIDEICNPLKELNVANDIKKEYVPLDKN